MKYLLDTNICIAILNSSSHAVRTRFDNEVHLGTELFVSSVAIFELWYGVAKSARGEANARFVEAFLAGRAKPLPFDEADARAAGYIRAAMEKIGRPIGAYDLLIAGQALGRGLTLVTANVKEFHRVKQLQWENWT